MRSLLFFVAALAGGCHHGNTCGDLGASGCTDPTHPYVCLDGTVYSAACQRDTVCLDGNCITPVCKPTDFTCDGQVAVNCADGGARQDMVDCAAMGQICVIGALSATCETHVCTPQQVYCSPDATEVRKCNLDGSAYGVVQTCDDPSQIGNTCAGGACVDRCTLLEARDRSTLGCHFAAPSVSQVTVYNAQTDLPAHVTVGSNSNYINPGGTFSFSPPSTLDPVFITSSLPVQVWAATADNGFTILHPEHTWSTSYFVAADIASAEAVIVTDSAAMVSADGGPMTALAAGTSTTLSAVNLVASAPVAVYFRGTGTIAAIPGDETMGTLFVVPNGARLFARTDTMVNGTLLGAGASQSFTADTLVTTSAPVAVALSAVHVPPIDAWRPVAYTWAAFDCTVYTIQSSGFTATSTNVSGTYTQSQPFFGWCIGGPAFSIGYGLDIIP